MFSKQSLINIGKVSVEKNTSVFYSNCICLDVMMLGEMVNFQKVNLPKRQLTIKVNLPKHQPQPFGHFHVWVNFLESWRFGKLDFGKLTFGQVDF